MSTPTDYQKYAVLYVDDEEQALKYFRRGLEKEFRVLTANGVAGALDVLAKEGATIGVIVTDQRMPGQQGTDLLRRARQQWPHVVRILVTAYADMESAIEAVNSGSISKYLTKPVDFQKLRDTLREALDSFVARRRDDGLLHEKMSALRRMVVADRVRSFAEMADGITHHLRNSMTAMSCFLEEVEPGQAGAAVVAAKLGSADYPAELWAIAKDERDRLVAMVQRVQESVIQPKCQFETEMELDAVIRSGTDAAAREMEPARIAVDAATGLGPLKVDAEMVKQLLKTLVVYVGRLCDAGGRVTVSAKGTVPLWDSTAVQIFVRGQGAAWSDQDVASFFTPFAFPKADPSDLGLGLLIAFFIAYHHGGDILVHQAAPTGPGFELLLPLNPAAVHRPEWQDGLLQKLFAGSPSNAPTATAA